MREHPMIGGCLLRMLSHLDRTLMREHPMIGGMSSQNVVPSSQDTDERTPYDRGDVFSECCPILTGHWCENTLWSGGCLLRMLSHLHRTLMREHPMIGGMSSQNVVPSWQDTDERTPYDRGDVFSECCPILTGHWWENTLWSGGCLLRMLSYLDRTLMREHPMIGGCLLRMLSYLLFYKGICDDWTISGSSEDLYHCMGNYCNIDKWFPLWHQRYYAMLDTNLFASSTGLLGFARLMPGDVYEITLRHGHQKWKSRGRIGDAKQAWNTETCVFKVLLADMLDVKVNFINEMI